MIIIVKIYYIVHRNWFDTNPKHCTGTLGDFSLCYRQLADGGDTSQQMERTVTCI